MNKEFININDPVVYIPKHLLTGPKENMIKGENLGRVTSMNDRFIFVRYNGSPTTSQATDPLDLFPLNNRPDLQDKIKYNP